MLIAYAVVLLLATVALAGGRPGRLADVQPRRVWLIFAALGVQVVITTLLPGGSHAAHSAVHLATYGLLAGFAWSNRRLPGVALMAAGAACNFAAIVSNGGVMPASGRALQTAGMTADKGADYVNSAVVGDAHLAWLGDVFALPASWPASNVFSVGDVLIVAGFAVCVHVLGSSRLGRLVRRRPVADAA